MKTFSHLKYSLSGLLCAILLSGCDKEENMSGMGHLPGNTILQADIEGQADTRTMIDDNNRVLWAENDHIGVFGNKDTQNAKFTLVTPAGNTSATFKGHLAEDEEPAFAYYPYHEETVLNGQTATLHFPPKYTYDGSSQAPMIACPDENSGNFTFRHTCGLLRIILHDIPEGAASFVITSEGEDAPALAGKAIVEDIVLSQPVARIEDEGNRQVTYELPDRTDYSMETLTFYIPLPVGVYPRLSVSLLRQDGTAFFTKTLSDVEARRAVLFNLPVVNASTGGCYTLAPNVHDISTDEASQIDVEQSGDNGTTTLHYAPDMLPPQVGDILIQGGGEDPSLLFKEGFLGKVSRVTANEDGSHTVTTEPAALTDAFTDLEINSSLDLVPQLPSSTRSINISTEKDEDGFRLFTIGLDGIAAADGHLKLEGELTAGLRFIPSISLKNGKINHASFTMEEKILAGYHVTATGDFEAADTIPIGNPIPLGSYPILNTPVCITPALQFFLYASASGKATLTLGLSYQKQFVGAIVHRTDGQWVSGSRFVDNGEKEGRPVDMEQLELHGELSEGIGMTLACKINNTSIVSVEIEAGMGCRQTGDFAISGNGAEEFYQSYQDACIDNQIEASIGARIQGSLFGWDYEWRPIETATAVLASQQLRLFPEMEEPEAVPGNKGNDINVSTNVAGMTLAQNTTVEMHLYDEEENLIRKSEPLDCGNTTDDSPSTAWETTFNDLKPGTYCVVPVIKTPLVSDEEGAMQPVSAEPLSKSVELGDDRAVLVALYESVGGEHWANNENWCTDKPLNEWGGVWTDSLGRVYRLSIYANSDNMAVGKADLSRLTRLKSLYLSGLRLSELNLSGCTDLWHLSLSSIQQLGTLNMDGCTNLQDLSIREMDFPGTDLSQCTKLRIFYASRVNSPKTIDLSGCPNLEKYTEQGCSFDTKDDFSKNTKLKEVWISRSITKPTYKIDFSDHPSLQSLRFFTIDTTGDEPPSTITVDVTDCKSLQTCHIDDGNNDVINPVFTGCTSLETISIVGTTPASLDFSDCIHLKTLTCVYNSSLTSLNLSKNTELQTLGCHSNALTSLDLSNCTALQALHCYYNSLTSLNLSNCTNLQELYCNNNQLTSLDLSNCKSLQVLNCGNNQLTGELNLSGLENLETLGYTFDHITSIDLSGCKSLTGTIYVSEFCTSVNAAGCESLTKLHVQNAKALTHLNLTGCYGLRELNIYYAPSFTSLNTSDCKALTTLSCSSVPIGSLDISNNSELQDLYCYNCQLEAVDVTNNPKLKEIDIRQNKLTALDLSNNTELEQLLVGDNQIAELDMSKCTKLKYFNAENNPLTKLDMSNTQVTHGIYWKINCDMEYVRAENCPQLEVFVSDKVNQRPAGHVKRIDISNCPKLSEVAARYTKEVNISHCEALKSIGCTNSFTDQTIYNPLEKISISDCDNVTRLTISRCMNLKDIDVSQLGNLEVLQCYETQISSLDVSHNSNLKRLQCYKTQISSLDVSHNPNLERLHCDNTQITSLDVSACPKLYFGIIYNENILACGGEPLKSLHLYQRPTGYDIDSPFDYGIYDSPFEYGLLTWGERDTDRYKEPEHVRGMQYPVLSWETEE